MTKTAAVFIAICLQTLSLAPALQAAEHASYYPRPVPMGVSISTSPSSPFIFAGTAGMRVFALGKPNLKFILSNNHVLGAIGPTICPNTADQWPPPLTWAVQPGTLDIGLDPGQDPFYFAGAVVKAVPLTFGIGAASNIVDAAIAWTSTALASSEILGIGQPNPALGTATLGMSLIKSGRTSGVTTGTVTAVNSTVTVNYGSGCGLAKFKQQIITSAGLGTSGDSGSVVLDSATLTPVGLYFAGSATSGIMNPILEVYRKLGVFVDSAAAPNITSEQQLLALAQTLAVDPRIEKLKTIQARRESHILATPGVVGVGIGKSESGGDPVFVVFCEKLTATLARGLPVTIDEIPVRIVESGPFIAH